MALVVLGSIGLTPLLFTAVVLLMGGTGIPGLPGWNDIFIIYSALTILLMIGYHWLKILLLNRNENCMRFNDFSLNIKGALILSSLLAVASCYSLLANNIILSIALIAGTIITQVSTDRYMLDNGVIAEKYCKNKSILTFFISTCLVSVLIQQLLIT